MTILIRRPPHLAQNGVSACFKNCLRIAAIIALALLAQGCATRFSPELIRDEIAQQRGTAPLSVFELNLGRFTTLLVRSALTEDSTDDAIPFAGLQQLQLAVYETSSAIDPAIDITQIPVRGWEPVVRLHNEQHSGVLLIRSEQDAIADLVIVAASREGVVYARLIGRLSRELPTALGEILNQQGPEGIRRLMGELTEGPP